MHLLICINALNNLEDLLHIMNAIFKETILLFSRFGWIAQREEGERF